MTGERRAVVVGAGIGGLATAIGLLRTGWQVRVLERAPALGEVGAGISLWPNAVRALDALGLGTGVRRTGGVQVTGAVRRPDGRRLAVADPATMHAAFGDVLILARADLLDLLRQAVPDACVETGCEVNGIDTDGARVRVTHAGSTEIADLVVGADGVRSAVRRLAFPGGPGPRYAGYRAYRLLTPPLPDPPTEGSETWGRGERVGVVPLPDGRVYWFAAVNAPRLAALPQTPSVPLIDELLARFGGWHEPIPAVLAAARAAGVAPLAHDVEELPDLDRLARGRVALLGDAAHAMTPNLGQGACQALEDAVELAAALARAPGARGARAVRRPSAATGPGDRAALPPGRAGGAVGVPAARRRPGRRRPDQPAGRRVAGATARARLAAARARAACRGASLESSHARTRRGHRPHGARRRRRAT